jgi:hypothetical protein
MKTSEGRRQAALDLFLTLLKAIGAAKPPGGNFVVPRKFDKTGGCRSAVLSIFCRVSIGSTAMNDG